jgi:hypothetical protein
LTNKPEGHRTSPPDFLTVEEAADVLDIGRTSASRDIFAGGSSDLIVSLRAVTESAFGSGVFGESDDEQA